VETVLALETREARLLATLYLTEECWVRLIQPGQHVLEHVRVDGRIFGELGPTVLPFSFLLVARDRDVAALPGGDARRKSGIVAIATVPQDNLPRPLLLRSGREVVRIGFAHRLQFQVSLFRPADANPELLGLLAKALTRRTAWGKTQRLAAG